MKTTLNQLQDRPHNHARALIDVPTSAIGKAALAFKKGHGTSSPMNDAVLFYLSQDFLGRAAKKFHGDEVLPEQWADAARVANNHTARACARMCAYLPVICTREVRHAAHDFYDWNLPSDVLKFLTDIKSQGYDYAVNKFVANTVKTPIIEYSEILRTQFEEGCWGSNYGGEAWAKIADTYEKAVSGEISAVVMTDLGFSLCHNGGPIFNKNFVYTSYDDTLVKILDAQHTGQVAALLAHKLVYFGIDEVHSLFAKFRNLIGDEYENPMDWEKMEKQGKGDYSAHIQKKVSATNQSSDAPTMVALTPHLHIQKVAR